MRISAWCRVFESKLSSTPTVALGYTLEVVGSIRPSPPISPFAALCASSRNCDPPFVFRRRALWMTISPPVPFFILLATSPTESGYPEGSTPQHLPSLGFLGPTTVYSSVGLPGLFHPSATYRIQRAECIAASCIALYGWPKPIIEFDRPVCLP